MATASVVSKSYYMVPQSGSAGEARILNYRETFAAAPFGVVNDVRSWYRIARGVKIHDVIFEFSLNDGGAGAGRVDVLLTNGTTTYTLIKAADVSAAGVVRAGNAAGALDWLGKVTDDVGQWEIQLKVSTGFSAAAAVGHYALSVVLQPNPAPDAY